MKKERLIINKKGFSVVEVIIASAVFVLIVTAIVGVFAYFNKSLSFYANKTKATFLAEEGLEAVRNIRDNDFSNLVNGTYGLIVSSNQWTFSGTEDIIGAFTRKVSIETVNSDTKKIISNVSWEKKGIFRHVSLTTYLTNWQKESGIGQAYEDVDNNLIYGDGDILIPNADILDGEYKADKNNGLIIPLGVGNIDIGEKIKFEGGTNLKIMVNLSTTDEIKKLEAGEGNVYLSDIEISAEENIKITSKGGDINIENTILTSGKKIELEAGSKNNTIYVQGAEFHDDNDIAKAKPKSVNIVGTPAFGLIED